MSENNRRDWFPYNKQPFDWDAESWQPASDEVTEEFEYTVRFPSPADQVFQAVKLVKGRLVIEYQFVFNDPAALSIGEE